VIAGPKLFVCRHGGRGLDGVRPNVP
jgi:hypothetical protein